jgi:hypothetical protein
MTTNQPVELGKASEETRQTGHKHPDNPGELVGNVPF